MPDKPTDADLIRESLSDSDQFALIFDRHYKAITAYLQARIGPQKGEELAADAFLVAFERRDRYDLERESALPWLYGIATNLLRHQLRSEQAQWRAYAKEASRTVSAAVFDPADRLDASAAMARLLPTIEALEERDRDVLLLYGWADLSYSEIAEALSIPIGTVRSRLNRVRNQIRELIEPEEEITE